MRVLVIIGHPAHVHLFKHLVEHLTKKGNAVKVVARAKECTLNLLKAYGIDYDPLDIHYNSIFGKALGLFLTDFGLYKIAKKFQPDILIGVSDPYIAHIGLIIGKPSINFVDTEHAKLQNMLAFPFNKAICTPSCYVDNIGKKQISYTGYHELAYLHPNRFKPNLNILKKVGLTKKDKFFILRFVSWYAAHDFGEKGFDLEAKREIINLLRKKGRVIITSESEVNKEFEKYRINIPPEKMHDLLSFADMYIGEGAKMASEAAVLGVPSIYVNTLRLGYLNELENKYGLVHNFSNPKKAIEKVKELLGNKNLKKEWQKKRQKMLHDKIDVTKWMIDFIEKF